MKKELESSLQRRCQKIIKDNGGFVFKTHGDMYARKGLPDLICCIPTDYATLQKLLTNDWFKNNRIGIFVGFEMKREGQLDDVSRAQEVVGKEIQNAGGVWYAIDDSDLIEAIVKSLKGEL